MQVPKFKAKALKRDVYVEGFYFEMAETTYCFAEDYKCHPVPTHYFIIMEGMTDWGLPNEAQMTEIDKSTLEQIGEVEI